MQLLEQTQECEPKYGLWPYKRRNTGGSITKNYRCVELSMMHICTNFERNPSRNVACRAHTRFPPKYDLWPYKRRNTGGSITKNNRRVDFYQDTPPYKIWKKSIKKWSCYLLERTQECEPNYDLWPYKRRNTEGSPTKNYRCVDLTVIHICDKFERNPSRNVACRAHKRFPPTNMTFDSIKDGTLGAALPKTIGM